MRDRDQKTVEKLEEKIEEAIAEIIVKLGLKKLPLLPSQKTMHLMAKAAVAVYEAEVDGGTSQGSKRHRTVAEDA